MGVHGNVDRWNKNSWMFKLSFSMVVAGSCRIFDDFCGRMVPFFGAESYRMTVLFPATPGSPTDAKILKPSSIDV
jgi:hypothetical protein